MPHASDLSLARPRISPRFPFISEPGGMAGPAPSSSVADCIMVKAQNLVAHDLPAAVRLAACGAVAFLRTPAHVDALRIFAAILAVRRLIIVGRHHYAGIAGLRVGPREG